MRSPQRQAGGVREGGPVTRILVVEDDEPLRELLEAALTHEGYQVTDVATGRAGLESAADRTIDLVVLDVNLPDLDGFELCQRLRRDGNEVPVVFLTARDARADLRTGLADGDDYLTKPFSLEELVLRIEAVLRRSRRGSANSDFRCGALTMDDSSHRVYVDDAEIGLTPTEYRVLRLLLGHIGTVLSKETILRAAWDHGGYRPVGGGNSVEVVVAQLRRKLREAGGEACGGLIHTVREFGYVLRAPGC
ncbi:MAG: response regulator transcription factor [Nocardioides sp.]